MEKITRRAFLKTGLTATVAMHVPPLLSQETQPTQTKSLVAAIKGDNLDTMTREALEAIGGIQSVVNEGDTVFIKPNFVTIPWASSNNCFHGGECTKPEIIIAVTEECLKAGAREIIIGEGSHLPTFDWQYAVTLDGSTNLAREASRLSSLYSGTVTLACLETASPGWVEVPSKTSLNSIAVSSLVTEADKVISIPVAKTHSWAQVTLAAKNFIGITPLSKYAQLVDNTYWNRGTFDHSSPRAIAQVYLDIVRAIRPDLSIIDFSIGLEGNGPTRDLGGTPVDVSERLGSWAIIASTDIMAVDATAARIMGHNTRKIEHLSMGYEMGLGAVDEQSIEFAGENPDNLKVRWKKARMMG